MTTYNKWKNCGIAIPYFNTPEPLQCLLQQLPSELLSNTVVVDDASIDRPLSLSCHVITHSKNLGYGGAQKSAYQYFSKRPEIQQVILLHGDNQYDFNSLWKAANQCHPVQLGSRYLNPISTRHVPKWRKWGNHLLTTTANHLFDTNYTDLHTGARIYSMEWLKQVPWSTFSNDFVFDQQMLAHALQYRASIVEFPIPANYDEGVSSISFRRSVQYGLGCLGTLWAAKRARF